MLSCNRTHTGMSWSVKISTDIFTFFFVCLHNILFCFVVFFHEENVTLLFDQSWFCYWFFLFALLGCVKVCVYVTRFFFCLFVLIGNNYERNTLTWLAGNKFWVRKMSFLYLVTFLFQCVYDFCLYTYVIKYLAVHLQHTGETFCVYKMALFIHVLRLIFFALDSWFFYYCNFFTSLYLCSLWMILILIFSLYNSW